MATFDPRYARIAEAVCEGRLKVERLPSNRWVQVFDKMREQPDSKARDNSARFVIGLVLVEAEIRIARGLSDIEPPPPDS
jgi:hypothetical protein